MKKALFSVRQACLYGLRGAVAHFGLWVPVVLTMWVLPAALSSLYLMVRGFSLLAYLRASYVTWTSFFTRSLSTTLFEATGMVIGLIVAVLAMPLSIGVIKIAFALYDKKRVDYTMLFEPYTNIRLVISFIEGMLLFSISLALFFVPALFFFNYMWLVYFAVGALSIRDIIIGALLLVLCLFGVVYLIRCAFYYLYIIDKQALPLEALEKSYYMTEGHGLRLLAFFAFMILLTIIGQLSIIGGLIMLPAIWLSSVYVYRALLKNA